VEDNIYEFPGVISKEDCQKIIDFRHRYSDAWGQVKLLENYSEEGNEILQIVKQGVEEICFDHYKKNCGAFQYPLQTFNEVELIKLQDGTDDALHYDIKAEFDHEEVKMGPFTYLLYLNNCNEDFFGGELVFPVQKRVIEPKAGKLVIFPTGHMYPHKIVRIFGGNRYAVNWFQGINITMSDMDRDCWNKQLNPSIAEL
jgi:hypothetical protein